MVKSPHCSYKLAITGTSRRTSHRPYQRTGGRATPPGLRLHVVAPPCPPFHQTDHHRTLPPSSTTSQQHEGRRQRSKPRHVLADSPTVGPRTALRSAENSSTHGRGRTVVQNDTKTGHHGCRKLRLRQLIPGACYSPLVLIGPRTGLMMACPRGFPASTTVRTPWLWGCYQDPGSSPRFRLGSPAPLSVEGLAMKAMLGCEGIHLVREVEDITPTRH